MRVLLATALIAAVASGAEIYYAQKPSDWRDLAADNAVVAAATGKSNGNGNVNGKGNGGNGLHNGWNTGNNKDTGNVSEDPGTNNGKGNANANGKGNAANGASSSNGNGNVNGNGNGGNGLHVGWKGDNGKDASTGSQATGVGNGNGNGHSNGNGNVNGNGNGGNGNHLGWSKDAAKVVDNGKETTDQGVGSGKGNGGSNGNGNVNGNGNGGNGNHLGWKGDDTKVADNGKENPGQGVGNGNGNGHSNGNGNVNGNGNGGNGNHHGWSKDNTNVVDGGKENPGQGQGVNNGNGNGHSNGNGNVNGNGNGGNGNHFGWVKDDTKAGTTKRPAITVAQPSSTNPEMKVVSSTTAKPSAPTPAKSTVTATTTKATPPLAEKSSTAAVTKATPPPAGKSSTAAVTKAVIPPKKDDSGQDKWKGKDSGQKDKHNNSGQDKWKGKDSAEKDKHNGNGQDKWKGSTQQSATTKRPIFTVRQPSSTEPAIKLASSTTAKPTSPTLEKSTVTPTTAKATPSTGKSSTAAVTKPAVKPPKDNSGQDKWKGKDSAEKDKHNGNGQDKWKGKESGEKDKHNNSGQDKWKGRDSGEKDKHNGNGHDKFKDSTQQATTTKRPIFTVRQPSSTDPAIKVASSTTAKPTSPTPEKSTVAPTTAKATPPPAEKSSTAAVTKPAVKPPKDSSGQDKWKGKGSGEKGKHNNSGQDKWKGKDSAEKDKHNGNGQDKWKGKDSGEKDKHNNSGQDKWKGRDSGEKDKHNGNGHDKFKDSTQQATTTKRPIFTVRQPSSTDPAIKVASSTTAKPTSRTPEKSTVAPTTAKATPAAEKSSTAAVTKPAVKPPKDSSGQDKWKGRDSGEKDKHNGNGHDKFKGSTQQATTTKRPIVTVRQPSSTDPAIKVASSTTAKPTSPPPEKSTVVPTTAKTTPPPAEKSSTAAVTKPAVKPPKDNSGQDKWKGKDSGEKDKNHGNGQDKWKGKDSGEKEKHKDSGEDKWKGKNSGEKDKHNNSGQDKWKGKGSGEKDKHNNSGQDKWKGKNSGEKDKHNNSGQDKWKDLTQQATTTKRPIFTVRQPLSTEPAIKVASSTTAKPTYPTPEKSTAVPTTAKATPPPAEKSSTAAVTKPAVKPPKDSSGQDKWKGKNSGEKDKHNNSGQDKWKGRDSGEKDKHGNGHDKFKGSTQEATTTKRPIFTVRQPSSTEPAIKVASSTTAKPTSPTPEKSTATPTTAKATPPPVEKSSTAAVTKPGVKPPKDSSGQDKWKGRDSGEKDKHNGNGHDKFKGSTQEATTTKRPIFTVRQPSSAEPAINVASSTTAKPTPATPEKSTVTPTTAKATPPPIEKSSTATVTKSAVTTPEDISSHNQGKDHIEDKVDQLTGTRPAVITDKPNQDVTETTGRASTTRRPLFTIRLPSSTAGVNAVVSSTTKPTAQTPGSTTVAPTTAKATAPPVEKTSPATSTKPAILTASLKSTLAEIKTTATTAPKTVATAETKSSTTASTTQKVTKDSITSATTVLQTITSGNVPTASPSTCNIYPTSPTATPRPIPTNVDSDSCTNNGYLHRLVLNSCCSLYMHQGADGLLKLRECPTGTRFDVYSCSCRNSDEVTCFDRLPDLPATPAPTNSAPTEKIVPPVRIGDMCVSNKNVYRVVASSGCAKFTQQGEDSHVASHDCPAGTKFDLDVCTCRHAFEVQCTDKTLDNVRTTPASTTSWPANPPQRPTDPPIRIGDLCVGHGKAYGVVPRSGCTKFTQQTPDGRIFELQCPQGLKFDIDICVCRYESDFTCPDKTPSIHVTGRPAPIFTEEPVSKLPPTRVGDECHYMGSVYRLVTQSGCARFTQLGQDGRVHTHECPAGLLFNLDSCICSYAEDFKCSDKVVIVTQRPTDAPSTRLPQLTQGNTCIVGGNVYALLPGTGCSRFTQEVAGTRPYVHSCPPGLGFDLKTCVCRYFDEEFSCSDKVNGHLNPTPSGPLPTIEIETPRRVGDTCISAGNIYAVLPGSLCSKFTQEVTGGQKFVHSCPQGLGFDLDVCVCRIYGEQFTCGGKINVPVYLTTQPSPAVVRSTPAPGRTGDACISHGNTYRLAPKEGCRWFTQTSTDGKMLLHQCPDGLKFDLDVCVCRFSSDFVCLEEDTNAVAPTTEAPKTTTIKATTALARSGDSCFLNGVTHRLLPYCGCSRYTKRTPAFGGDHLSLHECSAGNLFDLDKCACRPSGSFACADPTPPKIINQPVALPTRSSVVTTAAHTAAVSTRTCIAGGNVFRIIRHSSCRRFTQEAPGGRVFDNTCPGGLVFDMNLCICRYAHDVTCHEY